jgi:hypothetical protein
MDPVCSGVGVYVDGVFTTTAMGDALTHTGVGQMCSVCEGVVIKQDSQGNIVSAKWVRFEIHDAGRVTESGLFSGYFDVFSAPPGATKNAVTYKIDSPFGHSTAAAVEAPGPAGSLQSCVWGVRLGTPCREGL